MHQPLLVRPFSFARFPVVVHECSHCTHRDAIALQLYPTPEGARLRVGDALLLFDEQGDPMGVSFEAPSRDAAMLAGSIAHMGERMNPEPFRGHAAFHEEVYEIAARGDWITMTSRETFEG